MASRIGLIGILLAALAVRLHRLDARPLWWDEGISLYFAPLDLRTIAERCVITEDVNPPVYRMALGLWMRAIGRSVFSVRLFSATLGWLAVPLTWWLGRRLFGLTEAGLAALLVALSPFQVYYSQEAKGYIFVNLMALVSVALWLRLMRLLPSPAAGDASPPAWLWLAHALVTAAMLGAHYFSALLVLGQNLWTLGSRVLYLSQDGPERRAALRDLAFWIGSQALTVVALALWLSLTLPGLLPGLHHTSTKEGVRVVGFLPYVRQVFFEFSAGLDGPLVPATLVALGLVGLAGWGMVRAWRSGERDTPAGNSRWLPATWLLFPVITAFPIQWRFPFFSPRFLLYTSPVFYLLAARGLASVFRWRKWAGAAATITILVLWTGALQLHFAAPASPLEDFGPLARRLEALAEQDDALVYVYVWQVGYLQSYYAGPPLTPYLAYWTSESVGDELQRILADHRRLWLVGYQMAAENPANQSGNWLERHAFRADSQWFGNHCLALYLAPNAETPGVGPEQGEATFADGIHLRYPHLAVRLRQGQVLPLTLTWHASAPPEARYKVFVHLRTPGAPPVAQRDGEPVNGLRPTNTWQTGETIVDRHAVLLPPDMTPGRYEVAIGLYSLADAHRLPVTAADDQAPENALVIGSVEIEAREQTHQSTDLPAFQPSK